MSKALSRDTNDIAYDQRGQGSAVAAENTAADKQVTALSQTAARASFAAAGVFVALLAALHVLKPELDPSWRMVSEYEIGSYGWVMTLAFLALALSGATLFLAVRSQIQTTGGRVGLAFLLATAVGQAIAGIFTADPITASPDALTTHGNLHALGAMIGIPGFPIAATLISRSLSRNEAWSPARRTLLWMVSLNWISLLVFAICIAIMLPQSGGKLGPDVLIGWPNRFIVLANSAWLMSAAWYVARIGKQEH